MSIHPKKSKVSNQKSFPALNLDVCTTNSAFTRWTLPISVLKPCLCSVHILKFSSLSTFLLDKDLKHPPQILWHPYHSTFRSTPLPFLASPCLLASLPSLRSNCVPCSKESEEQSVFQIFYLLR